MKRRYHSERASQLFLLALILLTLLAVLQAQTAKASGFGVFTQGASGLGQANAVVAHPTGPSSLYFNPALLNDVPGRQVEFGTTAIYSAREIEFDSGGSAKDETGWNFPGTFYYTHQANDKLAAGLGIFFPFGLSNEWNDNYDGRHIGTSGEVLTMNINPVISYRVTERLSVAGGFSLLYLKATLESKVNQTATYWLVDNIYYGDALPDLGVLPDISQKFEADGWGMGFNLGILFKATDRISIGATYRSEIDVEAEGDVRFSNVTALLAGEFPNGGGSADITLPAQATAGIAFQVSEPLVIEVGIRWEDWSSTDQLLIKLDTPVLGSTSNLTPRDWKSTWTYNIGGQYQLNETASLNAGYLYGNNAVPDSTFEPLIPDTDAHLFTVGADIAFGAWTLSGAFGLEHHEDRKKTNTIGDPAGSNMATIINGTPTSVGTANGNYASDIYLVGISLGYRF